MSDLMKIHGDQMKILSLIKEIKENIVNSVSELRKSNVSIENKEEKDKILITLYRTVEKAVKIIKMIDFHNSTMKKIWNFLFLIKNQGLLIKYAETVNQLKTKANGSNHLDNSSSSLNNKSNDDFQKNNYKDIDFYMNSIELIKKKHSFYEKILFIQLIIMIFLIFHMILYK